MPVIREKKNFAIGPIGVARVSAGVAGSNAAGAVANAVADGANQMADMFFRQGAQAAEKAGLEQGSAVAQEKVLAIDPKTGEPVAYDAPQGFGTIAQEAYQRVVLSRFQTGIEQEIKLKAQEFAAKYDGSVGRYTAAMSDYISAMTESADGQFKTYIKDVGTSYLNATRSAMAIDQIKRERAAAASSLGDSIGEGINFLEWQYSQSGPEAAAAGPTMTNATELGVQKAIKDGVTSGLIPANKSKAAQGEIELAKARGLIRFAAAQSNVTSDELTLLKNGLGSGDYSIIPPKFDYIQQTMVGLGANFEAQADLGKLSASLLDDKISGVKVFEQQAKDKTKAEWTIAAAQLAIDGNAGASAMTTVALENSLPSVIFTTRENFTSDMLLAAQAESTGDTEGAKAIRERARVYFNASAQGVFIRALDGTTSEQSEDIQDAIVSKNLSKIPAEFREAAQAVIDLQGISPDAINSFEAYASKYRETGANSVDRKTEFLAFKAANAVVEDAGLKMSSLSGAAIDTAFTNGSNAFAQSGLKLEDKESLTKTLADKAAIAHLSHAFHDERPTQSQLEAIPTYIIDGIDVGVLSKNQIASLDKVRLYIQKSEKEVTAKVNEYIKDANNREAQRQKDVDLAKLNFDILNGHADGSDQKVRLAADKLMIAAHPELGGLDAGYLITKGAMFNDPQYNGALQTLSSLPVLPESVLNVFRNTSMNAIPLEEMNYSLRAWANLRHTTSSLTGGEIASPAVMASMSQTEIAKMDMLAGISSMSNMSAERIQEASRLFDQYQTNGEYKKRVEESLGATLDEFVYNLDGVNNLMPEDFQALKGAALGLFGSADITGISVSGIAQKLQEQINFSFPNDGWVANANMGLRSRSAPSLVLGANAPMFKQFFLDTISLNAYDDSGVKIVNPVVADLNNLALSASPVYPIAGLGGIIVPYTSGLDATEKTGVPQVSNTYLRPDGPPTGGVVSYTGMLWRSFADGGPVALRQEVIIPVRPEAGATPMKIYPVLTIRSDDPKFVKMVNDAALKKQAEAYARGNARISADAAFAAGDLGADPNAITLLTTEQVAPISNWFSDLGSSIAEASRAAAKRNDEQNANVFKGK